MPPFFIMDQQKISPIENFIITGINQRLYQAFNCPTYLSNSESWILEAERIRKQVIKPPYIVGQLTSIRANDNFYNSNCLSRRGIVISDLSNNVAYKSKILPVVYDYDIKYTCLDLEKTLWFMKRWLFARRLGYIKFTVKYGKESFGCNIELSDTVQQPQKEQETQGYSNYEVQTSMSVIGFMSEAELITEPKITDIVSVTKYGESDPNPSFKSFHWNAR